MMIRNLLLLVPQSEMTQRPEIRMPIEGLEATLREAYTLVASCQQNNTINRFFMAGNQAQKFRDIRDRIDSFLRIYPLISHIDTAHFIRGIHNGAYRSGTRRQDDTSYVDFTMASEEVLESSTSDSNPDSRADRSTFEDNGIESREIPAVTPPLDGGLIVFEFSLLDESTNNFSPDNIIGQGGYGKVYKGSLLPNGVTVAIKTRHGDSFAVDGPDFENEYQIIPKLQHANIIKLIGCCTEGENRILVYEYMPGGSLQDKIVELRAGSQLVWPIRFQIIQGIAAGIEYLHQHSRLRVIHGDLKLGNILLDHDMTPRISDFGTAHVLDAGEEERQVDWIGGTPGYIDPEIVDTFVISVKSDIHAFGVTLLDIIYAKDPAIILDSSQDRLQPFKVYGLYGRTPKTVLEIDSASKAWNLWSLGREIHLVDPSLRNEPRLSEILRCIQIALLCVQDSWIERPKMSESMTLPEPRCPLSRRADIIESAGHYLSDSDDNDYTRPTYLEEDYTRPTYLEEEYTRIIYLD